MSGPSPQRMMTPTSGSSRAIGEGVGQLEERLRAEGVAPLRPADRQLRDPLANVVADVLERPALLPRWKWRADGARRGDHGDCPVTTVCTAAYATGRCLSSSHSTFPAASASSMRYGQLDTGDAAAPLDPGSHPWRARCCSMRCARRGSSARTENSMRCATGSASRTATPWSWQPRGRQVSPRVSCSHTMPSLLPPTRPRPVSASIPTGMCGWPAFRWPTSAAWPSSPAPS